MASLRVLLAEDDENDALLIRRAVKASSLDWDLSCAANGEEALRMLTALPATELPHGIVTDIKMPRMSGLELLQNLSGKSDFATLPVVVLTSSSLENDFRQAMEHADGYYIKPSNLQGYRQTVERIDRLFRSFLERG